MWCVLRLFFFKFQNLNFAIFFSLQVLGPSQTDLVMVMTTLSFLQFLTLQSSYHSYCILWCEVCIFLVRCPDRQMWSWWRPVRDVICLCWKLFSFQRWLTTFLFCLTSPLISCGPGKLTHHLALDKLAAILADDILKCILFVENDETPIQLSLKLVPRSPIDNKPALVRVMAWRRTDDKPLPAPMMTQFTDAYMRHLGEMS